MIFRNLLGISLCSVLWGCGPSWQSLPVLTLTTSSMTVPENEPVFVRIYAADENKKPGTGVVKLSASAGGFGETRAPTVDLELVDGRAAALYGCNPQDDDACKGLVPVVATWKGVTGTVSFEVGFKPGASGGDGGTGSRWFDGVWSTCDYDGRPAKMEWNPEGKLFVDTRWYVLQLMSWTAGDVTSRALPDPSDLTVYTEVYLARVGASAKGHTIWRGGKYPFSCER
jgi:hypothetical protein